MMNEIDLAKVMGNKTIFAFETGEHRKCIAHGETKLGLEPMTLGWFQCSKKDCFSLFLENI